MEPEKNQNAVVIHQEDALSASEVADLLSRARLDTGMSYATLAAMINGGARNIQLAKSLKEIERQIRHPSFSLAVRWLEVCGFRVSIKRTIPAEDFAALANEPECGGPAWGGSPSKIWAVPDEDDDEDAA